MSTSQDTANADQTATSGQQGTKEFHWIMTVQTSEGRMNTRTAVITVPDGFPRSKAFDYVFSQFKKDYAGPLTVLFFDLQPNQL